MKQVFNFFRQPITGEGRTELGSAHGTLDEDSQELRFQARDEMDLKEGDYVSSDALVAKSITSVSFEVSDGIATYILRYE